MTGRFWIAGATLAAVLLGPITAWGQAAYPCKRLDAAGDGAAVWLWLDTGEEWDEWEECGEDDGYWVSDSDGEIWVDEDYHDMIVHFDNIVLTFGGATAASSSTALCPIAVNASTFAPQVTCDAIGSAAANVRVGLTGAWAQASPGSWAGAEFEVQESSNPGDDNPVLIGTMILLLDGAGTGSGTTGGTVSATCANSHISASGADGNYSVSGVLQTAGGPVTISDVYLAGVSALFTTEEATFVGEEHWIASSCGVDAGANAPPTGQAMASGSCSSSFYIEEH